MLFSVYTLEVLQLMAISYKIYLLVRFENLLTSVKRLNVYNKLSQLLYMSPFMHVIMSYNNIISTEIACTCLHVFGIQLYITSCDRKLDLFEFKHTCMYGEAIHCPNV